MAGKTRLAGVPGRYRSLVKLLNDECAEVVRACYMLFRLFRAPTSTEGALYTTFLPHPTRNRPAIRDSYLRMGKLGHPCKPKA